MVHDAESVMDMLALEEHNVKLLDAARQSHYLKYPPSNAVDGFIDTAFCSADGMVPSCHLLCRLVTLQFCTAQVHAMGTLSH
jgi:hypothetical protein